jgi:hypothetical protein
MFTLDEAFVGRRGEAAELLHIFFGRRPIHWPVAPD